MDAMQRRQIMREVRKYRFPPKQQKDEFTVTEFVELAAEDGRYIPRRTAYDALMQMKQKGEVTGRQLPNGTWLLKYVEDEDED